MDLIQIRYFLALARTLNFTRAAELCNVTQPALTKSIQRLEGELGGPLLLRERSHTQLTALGLSMLPLLQQTFDAAESARQNALRFRQQDIIQLRLGLDRWVEPSVVVPLIQQLHQRYQNLEITVRHGDFTALNQSLLDSEIDVLLTANAAHLTERANRWLLFDDPVVALLPEQHELSKLNSVTLDQVSRHVVIGRLGEDAGGTVELELDERIALTAIRHRGSTDEQVHSLVQAGIGIALSTKRRVVPMGIVRQPLDPEHTVKVFVAAIPGRPMSPASDAFLRLARARDWTAAPMN